MDELRQREREVVVLRAACDAVGTRVEVLALGDLRVRVGDQPEVQTLMAGGRLGLTSTMGTSVILDDVAELRIEPRGEDLTKSRARLDRAERDLAAALTAHGIASVADANEASRAWARLEATRKHAEERLAETAPSGVAKLRASLEKVRSQGTAAEVGFAGAQRAMAEHAQLEIELAQNRVTTEVLDRLVTLERELREAEGAIERCQARVRAIAGPVAALLSRPGRWRAPYAPAGRGPRLGDHPRRTRQRARRRRPRALPAETLERAAVADLDAAKVRFRARLALEARAIELRKQLKSLAPAGLETLRSRAAALGCPAPAHATKEDGEGVVDLAVLQAAVDERREAWCALEASAQRLVEIADRLEREVRVLESSLGEAAAVRHEKVARQHVVADKLAAARHLEHDVSLQRREASACSELEHACERARRAGDEHDAAAPIS